MGLEEAVAEVDIERVAGALDGIKDHLQAGTTGLLTSQGVRMIRGTARFTGPDEVEVDGVEGIERMADRRHPDRHRLAAAHPGLVPPDGDRILTTRDCYPPKIFPRPSR